MNFKQMKLAGRQRGASAVEYALIAALMAVALVAAVGILGGGVEGSFQSIADTLTGNTGGGTP